MVFAHPSNLKRTLVHVRSFILNIFHFFSLLVLRICFLPPGSVSTNPAPGLFHGRFLSSGRASFDIFRPPRGMLYFHIRLSLLGLSIFLSHSNVSVFVLGSACGVDRIWLEQGKSRATGLFWNQSLANGLLRLPIFDPRIISIGIRTFPQRQQPVHFMALHLPNCKHIMLVQFQ